MTATADLLGASIAAVEARVAQLEARLAPDADTLNFSETCRFLGVSTSTGRRLLRDPDFSVTYYRPRGERGKLVFSRAALMLWRKGRPVNARPEAGA